MIELAALDLLLFRDGKPFSAGEDNWVSSMFPPYPSVLYGALRTTYFAQQKLNIALANTAEDPTRDLYIKGFCLRARGTTYFPLPLDCVTVKYKMPGQDNRPGLAKVLQLRKLETGATSCPTSWVLGANVPVKPVNGGLISFEELWEYLLGEQTIGYAAREEFLSEEGKIGITRDPFTRGAADGRLYRVGMQRLRDVTMLVDFTGIDLADRGLIKLGGEGRAVAYQKVAVENDWEDMRTELLAYRGSIFKWVLATPAVFANGWLPEWVDQESLEGTIGNVRIKVLTAAIGKPTAIGGFDLKKNRPKPMYRAVPAGSAYYLELLAGDPEQLFTTFHGKNRSDYFPEQGFGLGFLGVV